MAIELEEVFPEHTIVLDERIDSSNFNHLTKQIDRTIASGNKYLKLDLKRVKFLSIPAIRYLNRLARRLESEGGRLALVNPSLRTRRHLEIFAEVRQMTIIGENGRKYEPPSEDFV